LTIALSGDLAPRSALAKVCRKLSSAAWKSFLGEASDGRNIFDPIKMREDGFAYCGIGRP
jgi:hypothetical protein